MEVCSREEFLADVASHQMKIIRNDGLYRHLEFSKSAGDCWHHWFEIVTWPNALAIRGDMGSWMFSRVEDMYTFFRGDGQHIHPHYWQEKIQHGMGGSDRAVKVFTSEAFKRQVLAHLDNYELTPEQRAEVEAELEQQVFCWEDKHDALEALFGFGAPSETDVSFDPWDGPFGMDWSYHFIWCCRAIVWAIEQYDKGRLEESAA